MGVAVAECWLGWGLGCEVEIEVEDWGVGATALLYAESHSRFVVSVPAHKLQAFLELMGTHCHVLGRATSKPRMWVCHHGDPIINLPVQALLDAWQGGSVGRVS